MRLRSLLCLFLCALAPLHAAQQTINLGSTANDGTGDTLRSGGTKINANFTDLYAGKQPLDADLTALAALTTTAFGRSVIELSNAAALRSLGGLVIGTNVLAPNGSGAALTGLTIGQVTDLQDELDAKSAGYVTVTMSNANVTLSAGQNTVEQVGTMSAARTVTLPTAAANGAGVVWTYDKSGSVSTTNKIIITRAGSDVIQWTGASGQTTVDMVSPYGNLALYSDGVSTWTALKGDINTLVPTQTGHSGEYLTTNGSVASWAAAAGAGDALTSGTLAQFAPTTSAQLLGVLTNESGTGNILTTNGSAASLTSFPTFNQNTTGSAAAWTTARTLSITGDLTYTSPSFDGSGNVTAAATVTRLNGTSLASLATGLLKNTTATGVPSIATAGTDYLAPAGSGAALTGITQSQVSGLTTTDGPLFSNVRLAHSALTYGATTTINFSGDGFQTETLTGNVTFATSNLAAGRAKTIRLVGDSASRALTFPTGWKFRGTMPTALARYRTGLLTLTSFGATNGDVLAAYDLAHPVTGGSTAHFLGDSITAGDGLDPDDRFSSVLSATLDWTEDNEGVGGTQIADAGQTDQVIAETISAADISVFLTGYNDMRYYGSNAAALTDHETNLLSLAAWLGIPTASRVNCSDGSITYGGSWTDTVLLGGLKYSAASGATVTFSATGTAVIIGTARVASGGSFTVHVDGVLQATYSGARTAAVTYAELSDARGYIPGAVVITGLSAGAHSVVITTLSSANVFFGWFAGISGPPGPRVILGGCLNMPTSAYAMYSPFNAGSLSAANAYSTMIAGVATTLQGAGLNVIAVNPRLDGDTEFQGDFVHPNEAGAVHIATDFQAAIEAN